MEDHNATEPEHEPVDARALVAALTTLLVDDPSPALGTENRTNLIDRGTLATACLPNLIDRRMSTSNSVQSLFFFSPQQYHDDEGGPYLCLVFFRVFFGHSSGLLRTCFGPSLGPLSSSGLLWSLLLAFVPSGLCTF
jgi:hypothetical protein